MGQGHLTEEQFDQLFRQIVQVNTLGIVGLTWLPTYHILSVYRAIPLLTHYEALAVAIGEKFQSIEHTHRTGIARGFLPPWSLNRTEFWSVPEGAASLPIGRLMMELGLIDQLHVQRSLGIQTMLQTELGIKVALGCIILAISNVSFPDFYQALGIQAQIPYEGLDASAPRIFDTLGARLAAR